jgi:KTSC domain
MSLPLLARGFGAIISARAVVAGATLGEEFATLAARTGLGEIIDPLLKEKDYEVTVPVSSSAISTIGYKVGGIITVEFKRGGTYEYMGTQETFMAFLAAPSKGAFFNAHLR